MDIHTLALKAFEILSPLILLLLAWIAARLATLIRAKTKNEYLRGTLLRLEDAVVAVVKELQQTVVNAIKRASADGVITPAEKEEIKKAAFDKIRSYLGMRGLSDLGRILGLDGAAVDGLIASKIEAAVYDLRLEDRIEERAIPFVATTAPGPSPPSSSG